jgi:hypothetical protein
VRPGITKQHAATIATNAGKAGIKCGGSPLLALPRQKQSQTRRTKDIKTQNTAYVDIVRFTADPLSDVVGRLPMSSCVIPKVKNQHDARRAKAKMPCRVRRSVGILGLFSKIQQVHHNENETENTPITAEYIMKPASNILMQSLTKAGKTRHIARSWRIEVIDEIMMDQFNTKKRRPPCVRQILIRSIQYSVRVRTFVTDAP